MMSYSLDDAQPLSIWAVTDNKLGHRNQLEGLISALVRQRSSKVKWIVVESGVQGIGSLITGKSSILATSPPHLVLGAGHQTHIQLLALKRCFKQPVIVLMKPSFPLSWFDLCLVPRHDQLGDAKNVIQTLGAINRVIPSRNHCANKGVILLGGVSKHFLWKTTDVIQQIKQLKEKYPCIDWIVASSPRTPKSCLTILYDQFPELDLIEPNTVDVDWLPKQMQVTGNIWVTEDSISMVYEAITSGASVGILRLTHHKKNRVVNEMNLLVKEKRVATLNSLATDDLPSINEAERCAKLILTRLNL